MSESIPEIPEELLRLYVGGTPLCEHGLELVTCEARGCLEALVRLGRQELARLQASAWSDRGPIDGRRRLRAIERTKARRAVRSLVDRALERLQSSDVVTDHVDRDVAEGAVDHAAADDVDPG